MPCALLTVIALELLEPYAVKAARTVLSGGKAVRPYLSQLDTLALPTVNDEWQVLIILKLVPM